MALPTRAPDRSCLSNFLPNGSHLACVVLLIRNGNKAEREHCSLGALITSIASAAAAGVLPDNTIISILLLPTPVWRFLLSEAIISDIFTMRSFFFLMPAD
ncbi:hypothetical protein NHX12_009284 [Muraenolepis orangiensis]|uniref:Uncharacterized protein n=1 Tax=Muraenolepis orangiensis TaxID=630683 RepID=A0A9Q0IA72_9TELE|nr:hypothetical protein NHX12_009284 [Muraenolepis orangiensis]